MKLAPRFLPKNHVETLNGQKVQYREHESAEDQKIEGTFVTTEDGKDWYVKNRYGDMIVPNQISSMHFYNLPSIREMLDGERSLAEIISAQEDEELMQDN